MKWMRRLLLLTLLGLLGLYPLLAPPAHRIDQAHCDRITVGMTRQQVEAIFGVPEGDYDWAEADQQGVWKFAVLMRRHRYHRMLEAIVEVNSAPQALVINEVNVETSLDRTIRFQQAERSTEWTLGELAAAPASHTLIQDGVIAPLNLTGSRLSGPMPITPAQWTGRHGSFAVWFDQHDRVTSASHAGDVKIVPPWQRWWRKYSGK